jgi:heavy metal sensor kinase
MLGTRDLRRISRGLRFRLTASSAVFFALLLIGFAVVYREALKRSLVVKSHEALEDQWAVMKGYLRIEKAHPVDPEPKAYWYYDVDDVDETRIVLETKAIYMIADAKGKVILDEDDQPAVSATYKEIGIDPPSVVQARIRDALAAPKPTAYRLYTERSNHEGQRFLIRSGIAWDERHQQPYYIAVGVPLDPDRGLLLKVTWIYIAVIPGALILGGLLGWVMAGRALEPVLAIAKAAQRISGSNLSLRIPTRRAGDELDYLILTFNRMIERLEASFQQMKQFSTDVSHELRTPITGIRGQLEVALFTAKTTDQYREAMFNALQDIDRLSQIVRALLLLSQAESGQVVLQKTRMNLCQIAGDLVDQFQIPADDAGVTLSAEVPGECYADVDRVQIERMITNLLSNALKFTPKGGSVRLVLRTAGDRVEIDVEDTGRGIATEYLPHIFDRFYRVPGSGTAPGPEQGLGLGLSFVAWIVKAHDGTVKVDSTPGKGTKFTISFPSAPAPVEQAVFEPQHIARS